MTSDPSPRALKRAWALVAVVAVLLAVLSPLGSSLVSGAKVNPGDAGAAANRPPAAQNPGSANGPSQEPCELVGTPTTTPTVQLATATTAPTSPPSGLFIQGFVYFDANQNGTRDSGEPGLANVLVRLSGDGSGTYRTTANGYYQFTNLQPGTYFVDIVAPPGYTITQPTGPTGNTYVLTLGPSRDNVDFGLFAAGGAPTPTLAATGTTLGAVQGYVFVDTNRDGIRQLGEPGIPNVTVLWVERGATYVTNSSGFWSFSGIEAGTWTFRVTQRNPAYPYPTTTETYVVTIGPGETNCCNNFGYTAVAPTVTNTTTAVVTATASITPCPSRTPTATASNTALATNTPTLVPATPTAISLVSFNADFTPQGVLVRWTTGAELNTFGFNVFRSSDNQRSHAVKVNNQIIPATGRSQGGGSYQVLDSSAGSASVYYYWLQEVQTNGTTTDMGPFTTNPRSPTRPARYHLYTPYLDYSSSVTRRRRIVKRPKQV